MKRGISSVSPKGQITIPQEIREALGVKAKDKVVITLDEGIVRISPLRTLLEESFGAVRALNPSLSLEEMMEIAHEEHARAAAAEGMEQP